ncbi:MAG TPA: hypothetical protein VKZ50_14420 [bacterium]|nr:hypothetical protein [bacterium]
MERSVLVAIGGHALIRDGQRGTIAEQAENVRDAAHPIAALVAEGWRVVVTHGNGPQVGPTGAGPADGLGGPPVPRRGGVSAGAHGPQDRGGDHVPGTRRRRSADHLAVPAGGGGGRAHRHPDRAPDAPR